MTCFLLNTPLNLNQPTRLLCVWSSLRCQPCYHGSRKCSITSLWHIHHCSVVIIWPAVTAFCRIYLMSAVKPIVAFLFCAVSVHSAVISAVVAVVTATTVLYLRHHQFIYPQKSTRSNIILQMHERLSKKHTA